jgi:hypothetical protein
MTPVYHAGHTITVKEITYLASFTHCPTQDHVRKMRRLMQYLKGTADMALLFPRNTPIQLTTYADAAFAVNPGSRSQYGIMHILGPLHPPFGKLQGVPDSSTHSEYETLHKGVKTGLQTRHLHRDLWQLLRNPDPALTRLPPTTVYEDNQSAINMVSAPAITKRAKHIAVKYHMIREIATTGQIRLTHMPTADMTADIFTKWLPQPRFLHLRDRLTGLHHVCGPHTSPTCAANTPS